MTAKELSIEQMEQALAMSKFLSETPVNIMNRLKIHAEIGRLYTSSMRKRKRKSKTWENEIEFIHEQYKSQI